MAGQGRLRRMTLKRWTQIFVHQARPVPVSVASWHRCILSQVALLFMLGGITLGTTSVADANTSNADASDVDVRLKLAFMSEQPQRWRIRVGIVDAEGNDAADAQIREVENRCESLTAVGGFTTSNNQASLSFLPRHKMPGGAIVFRARARRDAQLVIDVHVGGETASDEWKSQPTTTRLPVADLLNGKPVSSEESDAPYDWSIQRVAGDTLRVDFGSESMFAPDSKFDLSMRTSGLTLLASQPAILRYELYRVSHGTVVAEQSWPIEIDADGNTSPVVRSETAPTEPGVYEVRCSVNSDEGNIWSRLRGREPPLVAVGRPIIVLPSVPVQQDIGSSERSTGWQTVGEINPSQTASWAVGQRWIPGSAPSHDLSFAVHEEQRVSLLKPDGSFRSAMPMKTPGLPHRITLRFPADQSMRLQVSIARQAHEDQPSTSFVLIHDAAEATDTKWFTHTFVHYPGADDQLRLKNLSTSRPVAFAKIVVQSGDDQLATESILASRPRKAAFQLTSFEWVKSLSADTLRRASVASCQNDTIAAYRLWVATHRLRDYLIAGGFNAVCVPAVSGNRASFACRAFQAWRPEDSSDAFVMQLLLTVMGRRNLDVLLGVDVSAPLRGVTKWTIQQPELAEQLLCATRRTPTSVSGLPSSDQGASDQYNALHPIVQHAIAELIGEINHHAAAHSCFAGVVLQIRDTSHLLTVAEGSVDDSTLRLFADFAGAKLVSLVQLRRWVSEQGQTTFNQWKETQTRQLYTSLAAQLGEKQMLIQVEPSTDPLVKPIASSNLDSRLSHVQNLCRFPVGSLSNRIQFDRQIAYSDETLTNVDPGATVCLCTVVSPQVPGPPAVHDRTAGDVSRAIDRHDPSLLMIRVPALTGGLSSRLAATLEDFTALPLKSQRVESVDPTSRTVSLKSSIVDGRLTVAIINRAPWESEVEFECSDAIAWQTNRIDESQSQDSVVNSDGKITTVVLPANQLVVLKSTDVAPRGWSIVSWTSRASGGAEALERIKKDVSAVVARLGMLSDPKDYPVLSNGGFEQQGGVGLVGWLHAQHPPDSVRVDQNESLEGSRSVVLTADARSASRTWLVSETFQPPSTGRLAVSLAVRGELRSDHTAHRVRVSIEGTRDNEPLRRSREFDVTCDGKWQSRKVVLEVDGIEPSAVKSLRLTIDSLSAGRIWVDDVHLHDQFPLAKERGTLQRQAFLAVQGLQRGNLTPSAQLLQNHWAKFLLTEAASRAPAVAEKTKQPPESSPGVADRIRGWLPRPLRF